MKKIIFNTLKYLLFLAIGIFILWWIYKDLEIEKLKTALHDLKYQWLVVSIILNILAQLSRALRWKMLIKPMGYNPSTRNTFLSVLVLYFANLILPRAGEVARCTVLAKTDKVPFTKLVGTVLTERLADTIMLIILALIIFATNVSVVTEFFHQHPVLLEKVRKFTQPRYIVLFTLALAVVVVSFLLLRKSMKKSSGKSKLAEWKDHFIEGIVSIAHMEKKWQFIGHTLFIFLMWLLMLYVVFLAYRPTEDLTIRAGMVVFLMGGLAMLAPVQGGLGPWHFMVSQTLILYGINSIDARIFALIAHTLTNFFLFFAGGATVLYLLYKYGVKAVRFSADEKV